MSDTTGPKTGYLLIATGTDTGREITYHEQDQWTAREIGTDKLYLLDYQVFETREAAFNAATAEVENRMRDTQRDLAQLQARAGQLAEAQQQPTD